MQAICDKRDKLAVGAAKVLKDYCEGNASCSLCIFGNKFCVFALKGNPCEWELETAKNIVALSKEADDGKDRVD